MQIVTSNATFSAATTGHGPTSADDFYFDFNSRLRNHACSKDEWSLREMAEYLYGWADRFNTHFSLNLTTPAIGIDQIPPRKLGTYRAANGFGIDDEVVINARHLHRPVADVLRTLLHEMLHQWQHHHGQPSSGNYHNDEFQAKARELGIPCDAKGHDLGTIAGSPLDELLKTYGIHSDTEIKAAPDKEPRSKLKKWSCGCTNVRCAVDLRARCERCDRPFLLVLA